MILCKEPAPGRLPLLLAICVLSSCLSSYKLPRLQPIREDRYPPASRRLGEEGRVLIEFNLDKLRRAFAPRISQSEASPRLDEAARMVIKNLQFDPSDHRQPPPTYTYRVTVIFCLQPGHCDELMPFPGTEPVFVKATKPPEPNIPIP
jgi:TonB family protein